MEKDIKKDVHICITESFSYTAESNTTLLINCTSIKKFLKVKWYWDN